MATYVIFGDGRVGVNMASYLEHLGHDVSLLSHEQANENQSDCEMLIEQADIVAAAIPDDKLKTWHDQWSAVIGEKITVHFSGAVIIDGMYGFHPLYSFPKYVLPIETMQEIAFACPLGGPSFGDVFPFASNPNFEIADCDRARYHALAVLSGNLVGYIWNETAKEFAEFSDMPSEKLLENYLTSIVERFVENPTASLTGPIARHDEVTVKENLSALAGNAKLKGLYVAFLTAAWPDFETTGQS
ncbi:MAG: DUF2520 domain-containing protein [Marinicaulis sp.]|nr:DUF2520 domain-containing protein [Marinicaulis sp.]